MIVQVVVAVIAVEVTTEETRTVVGVAVIRSPMVVVELVLFALVVPLVITIKAVVVAVVVAVVSLL